MALGVGQLIVAAPRTIHRWNEHGCASGDGTSVMRINITHIDDDEMRHAADYAASLDAVRTRSVTHRHGVAEPHV